MFSCPSVEIIVSVSFWTLKMEALSVPKVVWISITPLDVTDTIVAFISVSIVSIFICPSLILFRRVSKEIVTVNARELQPVKLKAGRVWYTSAFTVMKYVPGFVGAEKLRKYVPSEILWYVNGTTPFGFVRFTVKFESISLPLKSVCIMTLTFSSGSYWPPHEITMSRWGSTDGRIVMLAVNNSSNSEFGGYIMGVLV